MFNKSKKEATPLGVVAEAEATLKKFEELVGAISDSTSTRSYNYEKSLVDGYNPSPFIQKTGSCFQTVDDMLDDESIFAILELKKQFVLSTGYRFQGPENQVKFLTDNITNRYVGLFQEDLYQIQSAYEYGFSLSEKVFEIEEGKMYLKRIKTVPPHSIDYYTDDMGVLEKIVQRQPKNQDKNLPMDKMLVFVNIPKFDNPYGTSDLQRCYRAWLAKQMTVKFWNIYLQRFASPFPVAKVDDNFGSTSVKKMISIMESIQQTVSLVIPKSADLELFKVGNSSGEYDRAVERYNQMIARALLLPDLIGFGQTTQGGSYSLGEQQFDLFKKVCDFNRLRLTELLNEKVFKQLIHANFGPQKEYARFEFMPYDDSQILKGLDSFYSAIDKGMPTILEDWNHIRDKIKFPNITEQDLEDMEDMEDTEQEAPDDELPEESDSETPEVPEEGEKEMHQFTEGAEDLPRPLTAYEERGNIINVSNEFDAKIDNIVLRAAEKLKDSREAIKDFISRRDIIGQNKFADIEKLKLKYMGDVRIIFQREFQDLYMFAKDTALEGISEASFASMADAKLDEEEAEDMAKEFIDQRSFLAVGQLNDKLLNDVKNTLLVGMQRGDSYNDIANEINKKFNSVVEGAAVGELSARPTLLDTVVRTNASNFYNLARKQTYNAAGFVELLQYSAVLDNRTTDICRRLDKKVYSKDDPIWDSILPPNHYGCRSLLIPITTTDVAQSDITPSEWVSLESLRNLPGGKDFLGGPE